jgi:hypothetical protein
VNNRYLADSGPSGSPLKYYLFNLLIRPFHLRVHAGISIWHVYSKQICYERFPPSHQPLQDYNHIYNNHDIQLSDTLADNASKHIGWFSIN